MSAFDIAIAVVVPVLFLAAVGFIIYRKVKHKGSIDCDCCNCSECHGCCNCKNDNGKEKSK